MENIIKVEVDKIYDETIKNIQTMVQIPSVRDLESKEIGAPFGRAIGIALDTFIELCETVGMRTFRDPDGYYGYAEIGPEGTDLIGILGHLDVVPIGDIEQWTEAKPFSGEIKDGKIISRGTLDDKGPMVMNLMAIKALLNAGVEFDRRVRLIFGCAEETTWECINKYVELEEIPSISFSPDANFPLINAEKTIHQFDMISKNEDTTYKIESLGAYNSVADYCTYTGSEVAKLKEVADKLGVEYEANDETFTTLGQSAHAMATHKGDNAIFKMAKVCVEAGITSPALQMINDKLFGTYNGENICGVVEEEVSGKLTLNIGNIEIKDGQERVGFDTRVPVLVDHEEIIAQYKATIESYNGQYDGKKTQAKLYVEEDSKLVSTLMQVYKDVTGDVDAKPLSSGGGTYSRALDNCVAFGCVFSNMDMTDNMHQPNESYELKFLKQGLEIYALAIYRLLK